MDTFELAIDGVYFEGTFVVDELWVAYWAVIPDAQLRVFLSRPLGDKSALAGTFSSARNVPRDGETSSRIDDLDLLRLLGLGFVISTILECRSGCASSRRGMPANHVPMPLLPEVEAVPTADVGVKLRGVSPKEGSSESGLGVVVRTPGGFFLATAVMHDRSKRIACRREGSRSRAMWLTWISSMSVFFSNSSVAV